MAFKSRFLFAMAWTLFLISLFLSAIGDGMTGWRCALTCAMAISELTNWRGAYYSDFSDWVTLFSNVGEAAYYFGFTIPNVLMILSPLALFHFHKREGGFKLFYRLAPFAALYVLIFGIQNWCTGEYRLEIGYYMWLVSFVGLLAAVIVRHRELCLDPSTNDQNTDVPVQKTLYA